MTAPLHVRPAFNTQHRYVCSGDPTASRGVQVVAQVYGPNAEPQAALFAAAHDMLTVLKNMAADVNRCRNGDAFDLHVPHGQVNAMLAAIAKAEGRADA